MLSVKQGSIKYRFFKPMVWLNQGLNSRAIGEHSNHYAKVHDAIIKQV